MMHHPLELLANALFARSSTERLALSTMRILLTSPSRPVSLALARLLTSHGHHIIGVELNERLPYISSARFSKAYTAVYNLRNHTRALQHLLPSVDVIISCTDPTQEDDIHLESILIEQIKKLDIARIITHHPLMQDPDFWQNWCEDMEFHVFGNLEDEHDEAEYGGMLYEAHALITDSTIRSFVVTTSADGLREKDFIVVPAGDGLHDVSLNYMQAYLDAVVQHCEYEGMGDGRVDTHLSMTFSVSERFREDGFGIEKMVRPVRCTGGVHDSLMLLIKHLEERGLTSRLEKAYTDPEVVCITDTTIPITLPVDHGLASTLRGTYSLPHVLMELVQVLWRLFHAPLEVLRWRELANLVMMMLVWVLWFKEERWDARDPWPAVVEWCLMMPVKSLARIWELNQFRWLSWMKKYDVCIWVQLRSEKQNGLVRLVM